MSSYFHFLLSLLPSLLNICHCSIHQKTETITPTNTRNNGVRILTHKTEVTESTVDWQVTVQHQYTWQFILILDNSWGFDQDTYSFIAITINSNSIATGPSTFDWLMYGFTVDNTEYFATLMPMDNHESNHIYPACSSNLNASTQPYAIGDISPLPNYDRSCDIALGCTNWQHMSPINQPTHNNEFPITFLIENDAKINSMILSLSTGGSADGFTQQCGFMSMPTNRGLKMYLGGNDSGQQFNIESFTIQSGNTRNGTTVPTKYPTTNHPTNLPTTSPTNNPTNTSFSPTKTPTTSPANNPTNTSFFPTKTPTTSPTNNPTDTSFSPTKTPTASPTINPTNTTFLSTKTSTITPTIHTNNSTISGSDITINPTLITDNQSANTIFNPSLFPSTSPTMNTTAVISTKLILEMSAKEQLDNLTELYQMIAVSFSITTMLFTWAALFDAKIIRINDYFQIGTVLSFFIQTMDMISDVFFVAQVNIQNTIEFNTAYQIVFYLSILFIVMPATVALFQLYFYTKKHWLKNDRCVAWLSRFSVLLFFLSVVTGSSFAAVALLNSYIFQFDLFDMGLSQAQLNGFNTKRVYSIVILENLPQLCLQSLFIWSSTGVNKGIAISSIVFSLISIIVSILSMTILKTINFQQSYYIISMKITGNSVREKAKQCRTMRKQLTSEIAMLIGVDSNTMEIMKPSYIKKGYLLNIHIYVNNDDKEQMDFEEILNEANDNEELAQIIKVAWQLSEDPDVYDIKSKTVDSKQKRINLEKVNNVDMVETQINIGN